jgi:3-methyladenine DNA glycosylase Tag
MPSPSEWHDRKVEKPKDDNDYFERMSQVVFMSGLNWRTLEKKWPGIQTAFASFNIDAVAEFQEPEIEALMRNPAVIRNLAKIRAVVANAQTMQHIAREHGSFRHYLSELKQSGGEDAMRDAVSKRFAFLGKGTTVIFLYAVGEELPKAIKEEEARDQ